MATRHFPRLSVRNAQPTAVARAVRAALGVSVATLSLFGATGAAYASTDCPNSSNTDACAQTAATDPSDSAGVHDLTRVDSTAPVTVTQSYPLANAAGPDDVFGIRIVEDGPVTLDNRDDLQVTSPLGAATGIYLRGTAVTLDNRGDLGIQGATAATGIDAEGSAGAVSVSNRGDISVASVAGDTVVGIRAADGGTGSNSLVRVENTGDITAEGTVETIGISATSSISNWVVVRNSGAIKVNGGDGIAVGLDARSDVDGYVSPVSNAGTINVDGGDGRAIGIRVVAEGSDPTVIVDNSGTVRVRSGAGIQVDSATSFNDVTNYGDITVSEGPVGMMLTTHSGDIGIQSISNASGAKIEVGGDLVATGIQANGGYGGIDAFNSGSVNVGSDTYVYSYHYIPATETSFGISATLDDSAKDSDEAYVGNTGSISVIGKHAYGLSADGGPGWATAYIGNGLVRVTGSDVAVGLRAVGANGAEAKIRGGALQVNGVEQAAGAIGILAEGGAEASRIDASNGGEITVSNAGAGYAVGMQIVDPGVGSAWMSNTGALAVNANGTGDNANAIGMLSSSTAAVSSRTSNSGSITVASKQAMATGIRQSRGSTDNSGAITVKGAAGAYGILAESASNPFISNSGLFTAQSKGTAAAIDIVGSGWADVKNLPKDPTLQRPKLYASGNDAFGASVQLSGPRGMATLANAGDVEAIAVQDAAGISITSDTGPITASNDARGVVNATGGNSAVALGAVTKQGDGKLTNTGSLTATGGAATGVMAAATQLMIANSGDVLATGTSATGLLTESGGLRITNNGDIGATATSGDAAAISSLAKTNEARIYNYSTLSAVSDSGSAHGIEVQSDRKAITVRNGGQIDARTNASDPQAPSSTDSTGIALNAKANNAAISSSGSITATASAEHATGIDASAFGGLAVTNKGSIESSNTRGDAVGVRAESTGDFNLVVRNEGDIKAHATSDAAYGVVVSDGKANVVNTGSIQASTDVQTRAVGIRSQGDTWNSITNSGSIVADGYSVYGIWATGGGTVRANNTATGTIDVSGVADATGIAATGGIVNITNAGSVSMHSNYSHGRGPGGMRASATSGATAVNSGVIAGVNSDLSGYGSNAGISVNTVNGNATARNASSGVIDLDGGIRLTGLSASSDTGNARSQNDGRILLQAQRQSTSNDRFGDDYPGAINVNASAGDAVAVNRGEIISHGVFGTMTVVSATAGANGPGVIDVSNTGSIDMDTAGITSGIFYHPSDVVSARNSNGRISVVNDGSINGFQSVGGLNGVNAYARGGDVRIVNRGDISLGSSGGGGYPQYVNSVGIRSVSFDHPIDIRNSGKIEVIGQDQNATGIDAAARGVGSVNIINSRDIDVSADQVVLGINATGSSITIDNSGHINAASSKGDYNRYGAAGIVASGADIAVINTGTITASTGTDLQASAVGVHINATGTSSFTNSGVVNANTSRGAGTGIALLAESTDPSKFTLTNTGQLNGAVITPTSGNASIVGAPGSLWTLAHQSTDLGGSSNRIHNQAGSVIQLDQSRVGMGVADNVFRNDGAIAVHGDNRIDMDQSVGRGERAPMINNGVIDLSSRGNNRLAINGDLAGRGNIVLDAGKSDALQVAGNVREGTRQQVNLRADGIPSRNVQGQTFATVEGQGNKDAFVAGQVIGQKAGNFVNLGVSVDQAATAQGSAYQAKMEVQGLNPTGQLAASVGAGVQNLLSSQIGTFRQRGGAVPSTDGSQRITGFVRSFGGSGDATGGLSQNFGAGGTVGMRQNNRGTEVGMAVSPSNGWTMGLTMSQSDGQQQLTGSGYGMTRFDADSAGLFATWQSPKGFYVDTSAWSMRYAGRLDSAAGRQAVNGNATALNLESGYTFTLGNGLHIEPQLQVTLTRVDGMRLQGPDAQFDAAASSWQRSRAGVLAWKAIGSRSGMLWTPYASASVVHMGGEGARYAINRDLLGTLDTLGTSTLFEAGLGVQMHRFSANAGLNLSQGSRVDNGLGGQLQVSYSW